MFLSLLLSLALTGSNDAPMHSLQTSPGAIPAPIALHMAGTEQERAIAKTIRQFAQAGDKRDVALLDLVMHATGSMHYQDDKGVQNLDAVTFRKLLSDGIIGGSPRTVTMGAMAVDGDLASVKARFVGDAATFEHFFSLLLVEDRWVIVGIIVRMTPRG